METSRRQVVNPEDNTESGFTLIETLMAFIILSSVVIIALSTMSESLRRMQNAARVVEASKVAQQALDSLTTENSDGRTDFSGQRDKFSWHIEMIPLTSSVEAVIYPALIKVSVTDLNGRPIPQSHLETIRMVRRP